jgi:hypothetical protein
VDCDIDQACVAATHQSVITVTTRMLIPGLFSHAPGACQHGGLVLPKLGLCVASSESAAR